MEYGLMAALIAAKRLVAVRRFGGILGVAYLNVGSLILTVTESYMKGMDKK